MNPSFLHRPIGLLLLLVLCMGRSLADGTQAEPQPDPAMMAPVIGLSTFMSRLPKGEHVGVFAKHGVCIVENFAPFLFCGDDAVPRWESGFRAHASDLTELKAVFGAAYDFSMAGDRAYFSLPTTWTGRSSGTPFEEHGAWAFVIQRSGHGTGQSAWRILSYGWGVTAYTESP